MTDQSSGWKPADYQNFESIHTEACEDRRAGRYAEALAKRVWYHENAIESPVRLSFALGDWAELSQVYPPALEKLIVIRDTAKEKLFNGNDREESFHEFASINQCLGDERLTAEMFLWLEIQDADLTRKCYPSAESALIRAGEYQLCGKYMDPHEAFQQRLHIFEHQKRLPDNPLYQKLRTARPDLGPLVEKATKDSFTNSIATIVALLVLNDRKVEAQEIAGRAMTELNDGNLDSTITSALEGIFPPAYEK
jgi:hypothetical protein